jgi:non-specific serine/threonine protein kinase
MQVDGLPAEFPPLRTTAVIKSNLPQQLTSFVGREREKEEITGLLSETRLLTLTGPGGTGKTRLSLEVAGDVQDNYSHGVWLVELAPLTDPGSVPAAVAELWGLRENPMLPLEQVLADYVRGKDLLLILDNCEHLVAASGQLAGELLAAAPHLTILASSREGLGVPGEMTYHLPTLRIPEREIVEPERLQELDSVKLFADRANAVRPGFELTRQNAPAVGRIVRRLDGIPLAIELAAARLKLLPPDQLAERIDDRFRLLTGGSRTALPRQQTLRALIDWSYDYLDPAEQAVFRQLGVFAGGWTLEAAETVVDLRGLERPSDSVMAAPENLSGLDTMDLLANLVNKSLVVMEEEDGRARFRFLETIRQYARDRLFESGEGPAARDRHLETFSDLVLEGKPLGSDATHLSLFSAVGSPDMMAWVERTLAETDNVRAAVHWALKTDPERALAMATKLPLLFVYAGPAIEARQWLVEALQAVEDMEPASGETAYQREILLLQGRLWQGNLQLGEGRIPEARETLQAAAARARQLDLPRLLAMALSLQSLALTFVNDTSAYDMAAESLAIMDDLGEETLQTMPLGNMIMSKIQQGDLQTAQELKQRAKMLMSSGSNVFLNTLQIVTLARTANQSGELDEAEELLKLASKQFEKLGSRNFLVMVDSEIGHLRRRQGDYATAEAIYRRTIREWQELGHQAAVTNQLETLGFVAIHQGLWQRAAMLLGAAEAEREYLHVDMLPDERVEYEAEVATLREAMEPTSFDDMWEVGRALDIDASIELALRGEWIDDE